MGDHTKTTFKPEGHLITKIKILKYKEFNGVVEDWVRSQKSGLDETLTGEEWNQIEKIVQRLRIQQNGNASIDYKNETERLLKKGLENAEVIQIARGMSQLP
jgi:hypothetical protein